MSPAINDPTTAVQTVDQFEDFLRRLGASELDAGWLLDRNGVLRLVFQTPTWEDCLTPAFDKTRQFGAGSVQVMRRLRVALDGLKVAADGGSQAGSELSRTCRPRNRGV